MQSAITIFPLIRRLGQEAWVAKTIRKCSTGQKRNEIVRGIKETGVKRIRLHDLRHSHASLLVEMGFQPLAIAERLGHEKIETTLNTYSHLYPNKQAELADRLEVENEEDAQ
jgi:integrase